MLEDAPWTPSDSPSTARLRLHDARHAAGDLPAHPRLPAPHGADDAGRLSLPGGRPRPRRRTGSSSAGRSASPSSWRSTSAPATLKPHPKGRRSRFRPPSLAGGETVWESDEHQPAPRQGRRERRPTPARPSTPISSAEAEWSLPGDLGRRYGGVSGDRNPIHMYGLTAKAFGFPAPDRPRHVDEGALRRRARPRLPDAFEVEVAFKRPILLPSKVDFRSGRTARRSPSASAQARR